MLCSNYVCFHRTAMLCALFAHVTTAVPVLIVTCSASCCILHDSVSSIGIDVS